MNSTFRMVVDNPENFKLLTDDLKKLVLRAGVATVNIQAAQTRKAAIENISTQFNKRNDFTAKNIKYTACPKDVTDIDQIESTVGATERAAYMELQETGGVRTPHKGNLLNIPTNAAREGGDFANKINAGSTVKGVKRNRLKGRAKYYASPKARAVARAYVANKTGKYIHYGKNVFEVTSFTKTGDSIDFEKKLIRNVSKNAAFVTAKPWLQPASEKPAQECQAIFNAQMEKIDK